MGAGTGMLSAYCLEGGAEHVTALDVNRHMVSICRDTLAPYPKNKYTVQCGMIRKGKTRGSYTVRL